MSLKFVILGSGSSMGVPRADGYSGDCDLKNKKNFRTRCSALIKFNDQNILIDTSPDLRSQLLKNKIRSISKVFYTHLHADQTHGINDLRPFFLTNNKKDYFEISENEIKAAKRLGNDYYIYQVTNALTDPQISTVIKDVMSYEKDNRIRVEPMVYRISFKNQK